MVKSGKGTEVILEIYFLMVSRIWLVRVSQIKSPYTINTIVSDYIDRRQKTMETAFTALKETKKPKSSALGRLKK
jgi:hypothetical protein